MKVIELKRGEAFIASQKIPHGSMPNNTDKPRIAANLRLIPREADNLIYYKELNGDLSIYKVSQDYYKHAYADEPGSRPKDEGLIMQIEQASIKSGIESMHLH